MKITWCHNRLAIGSSSNLDNSFDIWCQSEVDRITHVVNCRRDPDYNRTLEVVKGLVVLWNPIEDDGEFKPSQWFGASVDFALGALASPRHRVCVVCCDGSNRAPSTVLAILLAQGLSFDDALTLVLKARPEAELLYRRDAEAAVKALGYC